MITLMNTSLNCSDSKEDMNKVELYPINRNGLSVASRSKVLLLRVLSPCFKEHTHKAESV